MCGWIPQSVSLTAPIDLQNLRIPQSEIICTIGHGSKLPLASQEDVRDKNVNRDLIGVSSVGLRGSVDRCDGQRIEGWIALVGEGPAVFELEFLLHGNLLGTCTADLFRQDLADAGISDGKCAFSFETPSFIPESDASNIQIRVASSPLTFAPRQDEQSPGENISKKTTSRFGGLWIDRYNWLDLLSEKHRKGEISDDVSTSIFNFVRDGYVVFREAVPPEVIQELNADIERVWKRPPSGLLVETFEPDGKMRTTAPELNLRAGRTKMLDLYAFSKAARKAISAPPVMEFLTSIFGARPKAFQGLTFWNGSQQAMHKDTAYVKIDSNPMHLAATWLALEDIEVGTGELEYFVGSHRAPDFLFGGSSKWMENFTADHDRFLKSLHEDAAKYTHTRKSFLAKQGDILIWHADLAHGGSPITKKQRTRRSLVTHFTSELDTPFYRRNSSFKELDADSCVFVSQYADINKT